MAAFNLKAKKATATGALLSGPSRVFGVYWASPVGGGTVVLRDTDGAGTNMLDFDLPAAVFAGYIDLGQEGIRFPISVHATIPAGASITVVYDPPQA